MPKITVGNIERNYFTKQPSEKLDFTVDFTARLGSGVTVAAYSVNAMDDSGTSVNAIVLSGHSQTAGVVTVGTKGGTSGKVYTLTSKVSAAQTMPSGTSKVYEADIFMRISEAS